MGEGGFSGKFNGDLPSKKSPSRKPGKKKSTERKRGRGIKSILFHSNHHRCDPGEKVPADSTKEHIEKAPFFCSVNKCRGGVKLEEEEKKKVSNRGTNFCQNQASS